jgi:NAD(P)-dependent dehydrogenase (short-subunit alcohol dehydrogenase family)
VITGGSEGIGHAIASAFAEAGANLILLARREDKLKEAQRRLEGAGVKVQTLAVDLADLARVSDTVRDVAALSARIDVLVNVVGVAHFRPLPEVTLAMFDEMVNLNLKVPFLFIQGLLPSLAAARGSVINISSYWSHKVVAGRPSSVYAMTRAGINMLTQALASELGEQGIRVNAIAPGSIDTPAFQRHVGGMTPDQRAESDAHVRRTYPLGRIGKPEDVAAAAVYLASRDAEWVTGTVMRVDGGMGVR